MWFAGKRGTYPGHAAAEGEAAEEARCALLLLAGSGRDDRGWGEAVVAWPSGGARPTAVERSRLVCLEDFFICIRSGVKLMTLT